VDSREEHKIEERFQFFTRLLCGIIIRNHYIILPCLSFETCNINTAKYTLLLLTYYGVMFHALLRSIRKRRIQDPRNVKGPVIIYGGGWHRREKGWV
jgi:hypothetical protein